MAWSTPIGGDRGYKADDQAVGFEVTPMDQPWVIVLLSAVLVASCHVPTAGPPELLSAVQSGARLTVDGVVVSTVNETLRANIDLMCCVPSSLSLDSHDPARTDHKGRPHVSLYLHMKDEGAFPPAFTQDDLASDARFDFSHPNDPGGHMKNTIAPGSSQSLEGIPPGARFGLLGPTWGRVTKLFVTVADGKIRGLVEAPFAFAGGKTYQVKWEFNTPFEPSFSH